MKIKKSNGWTQIADGKCKISVLSGGAQMMPAVNSDEMKGVPETVGYFVAEGTEYDHRVDTPLFAVGDAEIKISK